MYGTPSSTFVPTVDPTSPASVWDQLASQAETFTGQGASNDDVVATIMRWRAMYPELFDAQTVEAVERQGWKVVLNRLRADAKSSKLAAPDVQVPDLPIPAPTAALYPRPSAFPPPAIIPQRHRSPPVHDKHIRALRVMHSTWLSLPVWGGRILGDCTKEDLEALVRHYRGREASAGRSVRFYLKLWGTLPEGRDEPMKVSAFFKDQQIGDIAKGCGLTSQEVST